MGFLIYNSIVIFINYPFIVIFQAFSVNERNPVLFELKLAADFLCQGAAIRAELFGELGGDFGVFSPFF